MRLIECVPVALLVVALAGSCLAQAEAELLVHPSKMSFPDLVLKPPRAKRVVTSNGIVVYLLEDHELPLFHLQATFRTGSYVEPATRLGLSEMTGAVMRTGGTDKLTGDQLDEELEYMAASIETGIGEESGWASLSVLKKDLGRGLELFGDVVRRPAFDPAKIELKRNQMIEMIRRRNDQPAPIAQREWKRIVYRDHEFGRISTMATVKSITRDDLVKFHQQSFFPNNMILAVSGDFEEADLMRRLEKVFGDWEKRAAPNSPARAVPLRYAPAVDLIEKDVPQAVIRMGHLGVTKHDPDWFALEVFDNVLGGNGFSSRLMREVRSNRGLAYSVASAVTGGRSRGVIMAACQTKSASCVESIRLMLDIMGELRVKEVSEEELRVAKDSILNSFVFRFTSSWGIVAEQASLEYLGLPPDWLETYKDRISKVSVADVRRVAEKHLKPDQLTILVVGKSADFDKPLSTIGPVTTVPLTDYSR